MHDATSSDEGASEEQDGPRNTISKKEQPRMMHDTVVQPPPIHPDEDADLQAALLLSMQDCHGKHEAQCNGPNSQPRQQQATAAASNPSPAAPTSPTAPPPKSKPSNKRKRAKQLPSTQQLEQVYRALSRAPHVHGLVGRSHIAHAARQLELHLSEDELDAMVQRVQDVGGGLQLTFELFCTLAQEVL